MRIFNASTSFLILTTITLIGCNTTSEERNVIGKWEYSQWTLGGNQIDLKNMGEPTIEFKEGGAYTLKAGFQENNEKWQLSGDTLTLLYNDGNSQKLFIDKQTADTLYLVGKTGELESRLLLIKAQ